MKLRYFNSFILIGLVLFGITIAGAATGNRFLTEPGQQPNPYAWMQYLGASVLMIVNGLVTIKLQKAAEAEKESEATVKTISVPETLEDEKTTN